MEHTELIESIEKLEDSLVRLLKARLKRDKARDDCERTWGYFGAQHELSLEEDRKSFAEAFVVAVRAAIRIQKEDNQHETC